MCKYAIRYKYSEFLSFMKLRSIIAYIMLSLSGLTALAGPAGKSMVYLKQPDGTTFQAIIRGDEFTRIKTTADGHAIIQNKDGWWHYAVYSTDGRIDSSGWKVGSRPPQDILTNSSQIPYSRLAEIAEKRRASLSEISGIPIFRRMKKMDGVQTRTSSESVTKHALVILAEYKDVRFRHTKDEFIRLLTEEGYSVNGATGSAKEYFDAQFNGLMEFDFHVSDIVTLPKNRAYYGENDTDGNDKSPAEMIEDACRIADEKIDFSLFDDDNDGEADNVFVFFAGHDEAEGGAEECIWSHSWNILRGAGIKLSLDGTVIDRYACTSELTLAFDTNGKAHEFISGIGTFCHEYSHTLGLPDFYDTDYEESGGVSAGLWKRTSIMDGGNYNNLGNTPPNYNAIERLIAGINEPVMLGRSGSYSLEAIHKSNKSYMIPESNMDGFYLLECRTDTGWDNEIGGSGLLVYHLDLSKGHFEKWSLFNEVNIDPAHQLADLIEADGRQDRFATTNEYHSASARITGIFFPHGNTELVRDDLGFSLASIKRNESQGSITFSFIGSDDPLLPPYAENITKDIFADAAIINFESSHLYEGPAYISWGRSGQEKTSLEVMPYKPGKYAFILENLEHSGKTYDIDIRFVHDGVEGESRKISIMTKRMPESEWPYIYLGNMDRNSDGSFKPGSKFPLRTYGAGGAAEIRWEFNGRPVKHGGDGYYVINESGTLQAVIFWEDGSIDKVMKQIIISQEK